MRPRHAISVAQVLRTPDDITSLAAALATRTAVAGAAQLSRLDTAYRIFATAVCQPQRHGDTCSPAPSGAGGLTNLTVPLEQKPPALQATTGSDQSRQEAVLRSRIAEYFGQQQQPPSTPGAGASAAANADEAAAGAQAGASAERPVPGDSVGQDTEPRAAGAGSLAGLPVRAGHSSLALDCRELLAWARSAGLVRRRPAVTSKQGYRTIGSLACDKPAIGEQAAALWARDP